MSLSFNRWTKGSMDRFYVSGLCVAGNVKVWLEQAGEGFAIRVSGTTNSIEKIIADKDTRAELVNIFGSEPTWNQMVEACA